MLFYSLSQSQKNTISIFKKRLTKRKIRRGQENASNQLFKEIFEMRMDVFLRIRMIPIYAHCSPRTTAIKESYFKSTYRVPLNLNFLSFHA